jgi:Lipoprotein LpqB beta-propeller domain/Sporulation and spore germination
VASPARRLGRMCLLAAVVASVAGCVGMPANGPAQESTAAPQASAPAVNFIGPFPSGPKPGGDPSQIVQGFLLASASYPTYTIAEDYLVSSASQAWNPGWAVRVYSDLDVPGGVPVVKTAHSVGQQVTVSVSGTLQASFDGSGQYVSAQSQGQAPGSYTFNLVKLGGQWRITNPPDYRMLTAPDFQLFYKAQDLYFFDPQDQTLVPDSVFVPLSATVSQLLGNLVSALVTGPKTPWLQGAANTELPPGSTVLGVTVAGSTVTVNLGGQAKQATAKQLGLFYAQLAWTLTAPAANLPSIQSVVLETAGQPWTPQASPCGGTGNAVTFQTLAANECFDPYPSSPSSFYYVNGGRLWARCGSESLALQGLIGSVVPVVGRANAVSGQQCGAGGYVYEDSTASPSAPPNSLPALSMAAVSPDGKYLAVVSAAKDAVYIGSVTGGVASFAAKPRLSAAGITAVSWDGSDDLWVADSGSVTMLPPGSGQVPVDFTGSVSELSVAPDGVRIAFIAQLSGQPPALYLAAIGGGQQGAGELGAPAARLAIKQAAVIGPNLTSPVSLAWYNVDNLVVLDAEADGNGLWEVPVDGQPAQELPVTPPGVTSITADGAANVLVAGLSGNSLAVSTSLEGPWYRLGDPGQNPAYPG